MNIAPQDINEGLPDKGFSRLLDAFNNAHSIGTDDVIAACLPLLQQVAEVHENGLVSPVADRDTLGLAGGCLYFRADNTHQPRKNVAVANRKRKADAALHIVDEVDLVVEESDFVLLGGSRVSASDHRVSEEFRGRPSYLTGYRSWEIENGHHDPLTDIFLLGMLLASLATGLDFNDREQLETFTGARRDLQRLNSRLHPVLVRAIERMTALERFDRVQDLCSLCEALENYRRIGSHFDQSLTPDPQIQDDRGTTIIKRLRARLYDTSRRNRLLYYRPIASELNLTEASVPLVINPDLIKAGDLFTGNSKAMNKLIAGQDLILGDWIRFEEMLFAPPVLARLRLDAMRVEQDMGSSPLRLIPAKLNWYDLKNTPDTPITSPLLLLKARLARRKGVRDAFVLSIDGPEADLNPALAFVLNQLYGMLLPEQVDLSKPNALNDLYEEIKRQILSSEPGVSFTLADKPKRRLLHTTVRRRLDQFQRRQRGNKGKRDGKITDYSYDVKNYKPLGVQLFRQRVRIPEAPFRNIAGRPLPRYFNMPKMDGVTQTEKSQIFVQEVATSEGRFDWSVDTSSVILGNFNYQKMSLLRDYDLLARTENLRAPQISRFFGNEPRENLAWQDVKPEDLHNILPSDPSQDQAVAAAQCGRSLVLQGPPGTGKSQTIANLISNFANRGKRVLFVSQKRAALDVVRNRLTGAGLGDLTAAFHDTNTGRAAFVEDLGKLYQAWSETPAPNTLDRLKRDKESALERLQQARTSIETLTLAMADPAEGAPLHRLLENALSMGLDKELFQTSARQSSGFSLPNAQDWEAWRGPVAKALPILNRLTGTRNFGETNEFGLSRKIWEDSTETARLPQNLAELESLLRKIQTRLTNFLSQQSDAALLNLSQFADLTRHARAIASLGSNATRAIAGADPELRKQFEEVARVLEELKGQQKNTAHLASVWVLPLGLQEAAAALAVAQAEEGRFLGTLFSSQLQSVRSLVQARTDLSALAVKPTLTQLLTWLVEHLKATDALNEKTAAFERLYGSRSASDITKKLEAVTKSSASLSAELAPLAENLLKSPDTNGLKSLADSVSDVEEAESLALRLFGDNLPACSWHELLEVLDDLRNRSAQFPVLASVLKPFVNAPEEIWALLATPETDVEEVGHQVLATALERRLLAHPELEGTDYSLLSLARHQLCEAQSESLKINAEILKARQRSRFRNDLVLSNRSASGLSPDEKSRRETVLAARRILENEFSKTRTFRPVRDFVHGDCSHIVSVIKPIWMMSPTSVADILPLHNDIFDVVIFDEASQITVEEALPACVRSSQIVVVGDSMQLPPSVFFSSASLDDDLDQEDHDFELNQESLLSLADEKLPSVMLRWHYRSRHEALIAFSNTAFYDTRLLSIPSPIQFAQPGEIVVPDDTNHRPDLEALIGRALSFHHLPHGVYSARCNDAEANYVAQLLRTILMQGSGMTIGVVAFSEAQQRRIEEAIAELSEEDGTFAQLLAEEQERKENGEFVGLFVKNLENVQGDERDIMIISVCYGPNVTRKMRMNFGPINKLGGERRLNVIFSRARRHMAIVSSITGDEITNDYNTGALALKTMLQFAQATSAGLTSDAERLLDRYRTGDIVPTQKAGRGIAAAILSDWVQDEVGVSCDTNVGLSEFVIDVVPRLPAEKTLTGKPIAILVDSSALYEQGKAQEMLTTRSEVLENAGWEVVTIPLKDIWYKPQDVKFGLRQYFTKDSS
ncbi:AAA domain-containing protein [uncultured Roseibium sp.]|uniref:AAA domain-containing protein n=1 Tax=uncultured Roseibium sp. TaxID=1936171 RepID=UPI00262AB9CE|nr:AAA domain-containing protein [uncultured Roseibium sp.]